MPESDRLFLTLDAQPIINRDPGDETRYRDEPSVIESIELFPASGKPSRLDELAHVHIFDSTTSTCACGATAEQLRRH